MATGGVSRPGGGPKRDVEAAPEKLRPPGSGLILCRLNWDIWNTVLSRSWGETCGPGPRHQGDKDTRNHRSRRCHHHRKRLSGRETTGRKLPLSRIWYLPLLHRPLPSPTPACHPAPTVERKCAFPDPIMPSEAELGGVLSQVSHQKRLPSQV